MAKTASGKVFLVGAGPGDPDLVTLKGKRCLERADVVVCDRLINKELLNHVSDDAELIYAGNQAGKHCADQREIEAMLVTRAREGKTVVRLKGGDPFVFGRGGEEAEAVKAAGIPFEIVPGVSSAIAVPAYAGIPLTHRSYASSIAIVTGHNSFNRAKNVNWRALACGVDTLVILMGIQNLKKIMSQLLDGGCEPERPVAVIQSGTGPSQRRLIGEVATIAELAVQFDFRPPATIVVGEVVRLSEQINWYESLLCGERVPDVLSEQSPMVRRLPEFQPARDP